MSMYLEEDPFGYVVNCSLTSPLKPRNAERRSSSTSRDRRRRASKRLLFPAPFGPTITWKGASSTLKFLKVLKPSISSCVITAFLLCPFSGRHLCPTKGTACILLRVYHIHPEFTGFLKEIEKPVFSPLAKRPYFVI